MKPQFKDSIESVTYHFRQYKPYLPAIAFIGGFLFDILTLGRIDDVLNFITQALYLIICASILILDLEFKPQWLWSGPNKQRKLARFFLQYEQPVLHFFLGALLSAFTLFYFKSSSLSVSALFLLVLVLVLLLNELPALQQIGPIFRWALFQLCFISYTTYLLPTLVGKIHGLLFFAAILISATFSCLLGWYLWRAKIPLHALKRQYILPTASVYLLFLISYGTNALPPIPLSLQEIGIYHKVERTNSDYRLSLETPAWKFWSQGDQVFTARPNERVYVFSRIFAPRDFQDEIFLVWQHWSKEKDGWSTTDRIPIKLRGGRELGFRGFAYKQNYHDGSWRILVETTHHLEIGRITFEIVNDSRLEERNFRTLVR